MSGSYSYGRQEIRMPVHRLKPGDKLSTDVRAISGRLLVPADTIVREHDIQIIRNCGVSEVWVYLMEETNETSRYGENSILLPIEQLKAGYELFEDVRGESGGPVFLTGSILREQDIITMSHFGVKEARVYFVEEMRGMSKTTDLPTTAEPHSDMQLRKKVLIVDDVGTIRKNLRAILESAGYDVVGEAEDGDEAIILSEELKPDLVTMDIVMKRMSGIDATRAIKREMPSVKIVMITQITRPSLVSESLRAGAVNFIRKPFEPESVTQVIRNALSH